jgi:transposase
MLRITLASDQRAAVETLRRDPTLTPAERDRVEMLLLAGAGWTVPQIAVHFACCHATVRRLLHRFAADGIAALRRQHPGPAPDSHRRQQIHSAVERRLVQDRTWTAAQLASALHADDIHLSARQLRRYLRQIARWRRVTRSLHHKQDPIRVVQAKEELAELKRGQQRAS